MESKSVVSARVTTLPSPPMERKPPPSPPSPAISDRDRLDSPSEFASKMSEDRQSRESPSSVASTTASPKRGKDEQTPSVDDYEKGLVLCGTCGEGVPFRDPQSGGFTLRLWDTHRDQCRSQHDPQPEPIVFTPETTVDSMANPPLKKRRAKRTEEERIEYLRTDPYVAQFEPYRVLCGSCNKWIRLRPNSTYCSIPWDAHRKSCLSKKAFANARVTGAADSRAAILNGDPDVYMFDAERVKCVRCDHWISVSSDNGHYALQVWYAHRDECRLRSPKTSLPFKHVLPIENRAIEPARPSAAAASHTTSPNGYFSQNGGTHHSSNRQVVSPSMGPKSSPMLSTKSRAPAPSLGPLPSPQIFTHASAGSPYATPLSMGSSYASGPDASPPMSLRDLGPGGLAAHDARRKNAEQRAAALRADPLLREVEPNRVFCGLCGKWVQLRQDSSFCAYPWHQHRGKCLARYQRRQEKVHSYAHAATQNGSYDARYRDGHYSVQGASHLGGDLDAEGSFDEEFESDEERALPHRRSVDRDSDDEDSITSLPYPHVQAHAHAHKQRYEKFSSHPYARPPPPPQSYPFSSAQANSGGRYKLGPVAPVAGPGAYSKYNAPYTLRRAPSVEDLDVSMDEDADGEGEADVDMDDDEEGSGRERSHRHKISHRATREYSQSRVRHQSRRRVELPPILADLRSASGRLSFISDSVQHLFRTTYERGDELSVGALVNYLNAAMPADKHDDFDVQEVTRAAASLAKTGVLVQEGDRLRPRD